MTKTYPIVLSALALAFLVACSGAETCPYRPNASGKYSANNCIPEASNDFQLGVNPGYYAKNNDFTQGSLWTDKQLSDIIVNAGFTTSRPSMFASFFAYYGPQVKVAEFEHYRSIGLKDLTLFISGGWDVAGDPQRERENKNNGCPELSKSFKGIYTPAYLNGKINQGNRFAAFVDNVVKYYGDKVKYIEVWNEPDLPTSDLLGHRYDYGGNVQSDSWWTRTPRPCEMINLYAPIYHYIRMLRITHDIVTRYNASVPAEKHLLVSTGGIGYASFLNHLLQKTDNPNNGLVTLEYPLKGGAYFDVLSYHSYPFFMNYEADLSKGMNVVKSFNGERRYQRHSDHLKDHPVLLLEQFRDVLHAAGYDGESFPKKYEILTEIGMHDAAWGLGTIDYGSTVALQRNTILKSLVALQKKNVKQVQLYKLGTNITPQTPLPVDRWNEYEGGLWSSFGIYDNLTVKAPGQESLTSLGIAVQKFATQLKGFHYDETSTNALSLPATMDGAAYKMGSQSKYMLWAKSTQDQSEVASATYAFPPAVVPNNATMTKVSFDGSGDSTVTSNSVTFSTADPMILYVP